MNAAVVRSYDAPPAYDSFDDPVPQQGERLVRVAAAALHPIVKALANGTHYGATGQFPFVPGVDGVGRLEDGTRVFFGVARPPFGSMAERTIASPVICLPLPEGIDDAVAAGIGNPAMSSWVALIGRARFVAGESVLILGATGVAGQLSVQIAKRMGARRIVAAGRNPAALEKLTAFGADAVISLEQSHDALVAALRTEFAAGIDVVLDYLWGPPAEAALEALSQKGLKNSGGRIRFVQIGNSAAPKISLGAATLRSTNLELIGSGFGSASFDEIGKAIADFFALAAKQPFDFAIKALPLKDVAAAWNDKDAGTRIVFQL